MKGYCQRDWARLYHVPKDTFIEPNELKDYPAGAYYSQGEPMAALPDNGTHRQVQLQPGDTVIFSLVIRLRASSW